MMRSFGFTRNVEQEDTHKDGEEATEERNSVYGSRCVEALEEDSRGNDCSCGEEDVVNRVDA
jgi:hypothetical protein